jgi:dTDP-glucose pyrophosphorylase
MKYQQPISERIVQTSFTILQSLKKLDSINKKLLLVFHNEVFTGVLSIGDIQKAIIANRSMDTCIAEIMRKDFVFAKTTDDRQTVLQLMQEQRIECMPVLDENNQLISAYLWNDLFDIKKRIESVQLKLPVVIMAGGQGNRLRPLTNVLPKPLIPLGEKTIIEHIMDKFCDAGCNRFYISVNYKAEMIKYYLSSLQNNTYQISYFQEDKPLGTAGSLHLLKGSIDSTFFISNCDILIDEDIVNIYKYHREINNEITIVAALMNYAIPYGILETSNEGQLESITEKPELTFKINTGLYILEPHLINEIPANKHFHITLLIENLHRQGRKVGVFPVSERSWKDIGDWTEYQRLVNSNLKFESPPKSRGDSLK